MRDNPGVLYLVGGMGAGGKERQILELINGLRRNRSFRTSLATVKRGAGREPEAMSLADSFLYINRIKGFNFGTVLSALLQHIRRENIAIVHTFGSGFWDVVGITAAKFARIAAIHGGIRSAPPTLDTIDKISRWSARFANVVVANSCAGLRAYGLVNHPNSRVIVNGIDLTRFEGIYPADEHRSTLCMVANFSHNKDQATLIRALPGIIEAFPGVTLTLVGRDAGRLNSSIQLVKDLQLSQSVRFVTDCLNPEPFIAGSQICVLLSPNGEGISNSILEYMALSKPVIATEGGGNAEVIIPDKTGFFVPNHAPDEVARKVNILLNSTDLALIMGMAGRQRVVEHFSQDAMVAAYEKIYKGLLDEI